jgi:Protein of unknown function (DUF3631)/CHC2 zinc finger
MIDSETIARARAVPIERIIEDRQIKLLGRVERTGPCPICGGIDRFSINVKKQVFNCRGCDVGGDVIKLVEHLDKTDFPSAVRTLTGEPRDIPPKINGKDRKEFFYTDASGMVLFAVERIEDGTIKDGKRSKKFRQRRPDPDHPGKWIWNVEGVPVAPYRLPELIEAIAAERPVLIVEGEKKCDLLWHWNVAATCNSGGANKWKPEHSEFLKGADVVLVPDHDDVGWQHIHSVGASLAGIAKRIRVLVLPDLRPKGDIIDWAGAGGTREQLDALLDKAQDWKPVSDVKQQNEDERAKAKAREDELLDALAKTEGLEYERQRKAAAKELEVSARAIDNEVKARREDAQATPLYGHWITEPWPEPVDGDSLLRDINQRIRRHVVCSHDASLAGALWTMFSWVHDDVAVHSPILLITSAEAECGKTTMLSVIAFLAARAIASVDISRAALFRSIKLWEPSFVIDEFDSALAAKDGGDKAELRSVINSGHTRGQCVIRCITDEHTPELFSTFAAKAIGMKGRKLPETTMSRCIIVELVRRTADEKIVRFTHRDDPELGDLRRRLRRWALDNTDALLGAEASMPPHFDNRRADNWRVLLAIADLCSGAESWGDKARIAAANLEGESDVTSVGVRLLTDIKRIFDEDGCDCIRSEALVVRLKEDVEQPWAEWNKGKGLTQVSLATLLGGGGGRGRGSRGGFGIRSRTVHPKSGSHGRGYDRSQFEDVWKRFLPEEPSQGGE